MKGALDDDLLKGEIVGSEGKINDFAEFTAFFAFNLEATEAEIKLHDFINLDDVAGGSEIVVGIYNHAVLRVFADAFDGENIGGAGATDDKSDNFERVGINDEIDKASDLGGSLHAEDWCAD